MGAMVFHIGSDPDGYGGSEEVSAEQAQAYAEAIAAGLREAFPDVEVRIAPSTDWSLEPERLKLSAWVQRNWRRLRAEVNAARGWAEQVGGTLRPEINRDD